MKLDTGQWLGLAGLYGPEQKQASARLTWDRWHTGHF